MMGLLQPTQPLPPGIGRSVSPPVGAQIAPPGVGGATPSPISPQMAQMAQAGAGAASGQPDLFQRVAQLMISDPKWILIMSGMGLREALEKSGKYESKPHRSSEELAAAGVPVGNPGQTGMTSPGQMVKQMQPPMPSIPGV